jgi:hypothetical protein
LGCPHYAAAWLGQNLIGPWPRPKRSKFFRVAVEILAVVFPKSRVFPAKRMIGGWSRMKFHDFEIILPVDKKINPLHRSSTAGDSRGFINVAENI